jgi:hypothetical protein
LIIFENGNAGWEEIAPEQDHIFGDRLLAARDFKASVIKGAAISIP